MKNSKLKLLALCFFVLSHTALAEKPLAMITKIKGTGTTSGQNMRLLSYLNLGDKAKVTKGSEVVFSFLNGKIRATATGPCELQLTNKGPVLLSGQAKQLRIESPNKRVSAVLPSELELGKGGHIRRGELALHLSEKLLPGKQNLKVSGLPSFETYYLTVTNASTFEDVYEAEIKKGDSFPIPSGILEAGQSYDFLVQATSAWGQTFEVEETSVVLSDELSQSLQPHLLSTKISEAQFPQATELLVVYIQHGLDQQALETVEELLEVDNTHPKLIELRHNLRRRLRYSSDA